jgi:hypothetical protein
MDCKNKILGYEKAKKSLKKENKERLLNSEDDLGRYFDF